MNYLQKKKLAFMSIVNRIKGFIRTVTGVLPLTLEGCVDEESIIDYTLYGQSVQDGTPMPDTPIEVESVGEFDETTGKYKIPIKVSGNDKTITTNIYLDEPLRKVGNYADYIKSIDLVNGTGVVVRNVKKKQLTKASKVYVWVNKKGVTFVDALDSNYTHNKALCNRNGCYTNNGSETITMWLGISSKFIYWIGILDYLGFTTLEEMNEWLTNNPTYVFYGTDLPTETPITLPTIPTFKGTSILTADTTIQPSNAEVTYYSNVKE